MISCHAQTDVGRHRSLNEDAIFARDNLFVVCDGMGGHTAGEVASQLAIDVIAAFVRQSAEDAEITWPYGFQRNTSFDGNRLRTGIKLANRAVFRKGTYSEAYRGMGTTVAAMIMSQSGPLMTYAHVGDSRLYLIRESVIHQLTHDDSWANLSLEGGPPEYAANAAKKNLLTKALGTLEDVDFEVMERELNDGDVVLLCSDGLTNMVPDQSILDIVLAREADLEGACSALVTEANARGGRDNISAILVGYHFSGEARLPSNKPSGLSSS